jgi:hypothetical protein
VAENGWGSWGTPRPPRKPLTLQGAQTARYCPRCDTKTVWTLDGNPAHPGLQACECGMTVATLLDLDELDNARRHYQLTRTELDDMVGLPAPART